jgi:hypothetical protein
MKTKYNPMRRTLEVSKRLFLALLLSGVPHLYADQGADSPVVEPKENSIKPNEEPTEPDNSRDTVPLVGPSGEEIHNFLYPTTANHKVVIRAN